MQVSQQSGLSPSPDLSQEPRHAIYGVGEMAERTRHFDWSATSVGTVEQWPLTLLVTVNTILSSHYPMFLWWGEDLVQFYNDGYRPSIRDDKHPNALGQKGIDCWPEIWPIIGPQIDAVMRRGESSWNENQLVPIFRNGCLEDVYWTYSYSPVRDPAGNIRGTLVVCTDTTAIVLARDQLRRENERLADLFQQAPAFFAALSGPTHVFEMINPHYQTLVGDRDLLGKTVSEAVPEADGQGFIHLLDRVYQTGEPHIGRSTPIQLARTADQPLEMRYLDFVYQPRLDAQGTICGIIALGVDVTARKLTEQLLLQSEKLNAVGRLASSIAHEINNPLEAVTNLVYLARYSAVNPDTIQYLDMAEVELQRVSAITSQALRFYRQSSQPRLIALDELIDQTLPLYQGRLNNASVQIERRTRTDLPVHCFDGEIRQVLSNFIANAIDALQSSGGRLILRTRSAKNWSTERTGVVLTIADSGDGMSLSTQARIFEPFFTTKGIRGSGLGLWISKEIIDRHHGILRVSSRQAHPGQLDGPGQHGTVFTIFLPVVAGLEPVRSE